MKKLCAHTLTCKRPFSFQSQRRDAKMPKNVQTIIQLCSLHMLATLCSKSFKLGFSSLWTENFQIHKLGFEELEEPEINCQYPLDYGESEGVPEKTSTSVSLTMLMPLTVWITTNYGKFLKRWEHQTTVCVSWETSCRSRSNSYSQTWNNQLVQNWERSTTRLYIVTLLI